MASGVIKGLGTTNEYQNGQLVGGQNVYREGENVFVYTGRTEQNTGLGLFQQNITTAPENPKSAAPLTLTTEDGFVPTGSTVPNKIITKEEIETKLNQSFTTEEAARKEYEKKFGTTISNPKDELNKLSQGQTYNVFTKKYEKTPIETISRRTVEEGDVGSMIEFASQKAKSDYQIYKASSFAGNQIQPTDLQLEKGSMIEKASVTMNIPERREMQNIFFKDKDTGELMGGTRETVYGGTTTENMFFVKTPTQLKKEKEQQVEFFNIQRGREIVGKDKNKFGLLAPITMPVSELISAVYKETIEGKKGSYNEFVLSNVGKTPQIKKEIYMKNGELKSRPSTKEVISYTTNLSRFEKTAIGSYLTYKALSFVGSKGLRIGLQYTPKKIIASKIVTNTGQFIESHPNIISRSFDAAYVGLMGWDIYSKKKSGVETSQIIGEVGRDIIRFYGFKSGAKEGLTPKIIERPAQITPKITPITRVGKKTTFVAKLTGEKTIIEKAPIEIDLPLKSDIRFNIPSIKAVPSEKKIKIPTIEKKDNIKTFNIPLTSKEANVNIPSFKFGKAREINLPKPAIKQNEINIPKTLKLGKRTETTIPFESVSGSGSVLEETGRQSKSMANFNIIFKSPKTGKYYSNIIKVGSADISGGAVEKSVIGRERVRLRVVTDLPKDVGGFSGYTLKDNKIITRLIDIRKKFPENPKDVLKHEMFHQIRTQNTYGDELKNYFTGIEKKTGIDYSKSTFEQMPIDIYENLPQEKGARFFAKLPDFLASKIWKRSMKVEAVVRTELPTDFTRSYIKGTSGEFDIGFGKKNLFIIREKSGVKNQKGFEGFAVSKETTREEVNIPLKMIDKIGRKTNIEKLEPIKEITTRYGKGFTVSDGKLSQVEGRLSIYKMEKFTEKNKDTNIISEADRLFFKTQRTVPKQKGLSEEASQDMFRLSIGAGGEAGAIARNIYTKELPTIPKIGFVTPERGRVSSATSLSPNIQYQKYPTRSEFQFSSLIKGGFEPKPESRISLKGIDTGKETFSTSPISISISEPTKQDTYSITRLAQDTKQEEEYATKQQPPTEPIFSTTSVTSYPYLPTPFFAIPNVGADDLRKKKKQKKYKIPTRYTPTLVGTLFYPRIKKAPKEVGISGVGIRPQVEGNVPKEARLTPPKSMASRFFNMMFARKPKNPQNESAKRKYNEQFSKNVLNFRGVGK
jgi:hypothetical protein